MQRLQGGNRQAAHNAQLRNRNASARSSLDVGRFRQALQTAMTRPSPRHGAPAAPRQSVNPLYLEWKRIETGLKKHNMGLVGDSQTTVPSTFEEFLTHRAEYAAQITHEDELHDTRNLECCRVNKLLARPVFNHYVDINIPMDGTSTVLGFPTVWTAVHFEEEDKDGLGYRHPWKMVSSWPSAEEWREEGDERHTSNFARFLPLPRVKGDNAAVNYKQKHFLPQEELDDVCPVPAARVFNPGLFHARDGFPYDDPRMVGAEAYADANPMEYVDDESLMLYGQGAYSSANGEIVYGAGPYAQGCRLNPADAAAESMAVVFHDPVQEERRSRLLASLTLGGNTFVSRAARRARRGQGNILGAGGYTDSSNPIFNPSRLTSLKHQIPPFQAPDGSLIKGAGPKNDPIDPHAALTAWHRANSPGKGADGYPPPTHRHTPESLRAVGASRPVADDAACHKVASAVAEEALKEPDSELPPLSQGLSSFPIVAHGGKVMRFNPEVKEFVPLSPDMQKTPQPHHVNHNSKDGSQSTRDNSPDRKSEVSAGVYTTGETSRRMSDATFGSGSESWPLNEAGERDSGGRGRGRSVPFPSPPRGSGGVGDSGLQWAGGDRFTAYGHGVLTHIDENDDGFGEHVNSHDYPGNLVNTADFAPHE